MDRRCFQERGRLLDHLRFTKLPTTAPLFFAKILNEGRTIIFWRYYFLLWTKQHVRLVKELELH